MDKRYLRIGLAVVVLAVLFSIGASSPQRVAAVTIMSPDDVDADVDGFTYQGYLEQNGVPAQGYFDFEVSVWTGSATGYAVGTSSGLTGIYVDNGIFSFIVYLDEALNDVFKGPARYIQVKVRPTGTSTWTTMARQPLTPVPIAWSLHPGSIILGAETTALLEIENRNTGSNSAALEVKGSSSAAGAIAAYNDSGGGPAIYGNVDTSGSAIHGTNMSSGSGVYGTSSTGTGVTGICTSASGYGVVGMQGTVTMNDIPVSFMESGGVFGGEIGIIAMTETDNSSAINGRVVMGSSNDAWAGFFTNLYGNGVYIKGGTGKEGLTVAGGTKSAVVATGDGARLLYSEESTEVFFTDYGFGQLVDGEVLVMIDPVYAQTVNLEEPYHVFIEAYGDADIYVTDRTAESFRVVLRDGDDSVEFSYRIVATRLGYEGHRLERSPNADDIMDDVALPYQATE